MNENQYRFCEECGKWAMGTSICKQTDDKWQWLIVCGECAEKHSMDVTVVNENIIDRCAITTEIYECIDKINKMLLEE